MKSPLIVDLVVKLNPVIGGNTAETLDNAACVASFLSRYQSDLSDALCNAEMHPGRYGPDQLTGDQARGLYLLSAALESALWFEAKGRHQAEGVQP